MTCFEIHIQLDKKHHPKEFAEVLRQAAAATLHHLQVEPPASLTIVLDDDARLCTLNRQFRGIDKPTDVLSFPDDDLDPYLGDVVISWDRVQAQAIAGGHPAQAELQLLAVHGVLHLLGHDHATTEQRDAMWATQAAILTALGAPITGPALE